jgi:hypothetical protein
MLFQLFYHSFKTSVEHCKNAQHFTTKNIILCGDEKYHVISHIKPSPYFMKDTGRGGTIHFYHAWPQ